MTNVIDIVMTIVNFISSLSSDALVKLLIFAVTISFGWIFFSGIFTLIRRSFMIYDITLINRLNTACEFATRIAGSGSENIKGSDNTELNPMWTFHYQVAPKWEALIGSSTLHIRIIRRDSKDNKKKLSVILPVYNSGDIQRSRLFFIEDSGIREFSTSQTDSWDWSEDHQFGQQGN